jgi:hypothetical protein
MRIALSLNGVRCVLLGLLPGPLMAACGAAILSVRSLRDARFLAA